MQLLYEPTLTTAIDSRYDMTPALVSSSQPLQLRRPDKGATLTQTSVQVSSAFQVCASISHLITSRLTLTSGQLVRRTFIPPLYQGKLQRGGLRHCVTRCRWCEAVSFHAQSKRLLLLTICSATSIADHLNTAFALIHKERPRPNVVGRMVRMECCQP